MIIYSFTKYFFFVGNENITGNNNIKTGIQILYIDRYAWLSLVRSITLKIFRFELIIDKNNTPKTEPICLTTLMTLCDDVSNDPLKLEAANTFIGPAIMPKPIPNISNATESQVEFVAPFITIKM